MGALVVKYFLTAIAVWILVVFGYNFPNQLASVVTWIDALLAAAAENAEPTGTIRLIFQLAGAGFVALMAIVVVCLGSIWNGRKILTRFLPSKLPNLGTIHWGIILTAGFVPLLAHAVKWGLGFWWPALLVPVQQLADLALGWLQPATQVTLGLFHTRDHLMTIIIGFVLMMLWWLVVAIVWPLLKSAWRRMFLRRQPTVPPQPPAPSGRKEDFMKTFFKWLGSLLMSPFRFVWRVIKWPFTHDIILGPITWFIVQLGLALGAGLLVTEGMEWGLNTLSTTPLQNFPHVWVWGFFSLLFLLPRWKEETTGEGENTKVSWKLDIFRVINPGRGAQLTWLGMVTPFILKTGTYPYLGERFGFAWLKIDSTTIADKEGLLILGDITFQVWQSPSASENSKERTTITLQAGNGGTVSGNLAFVMPGRRRYKWVVAGDAGLQLGNRGRQELQEIIERFTDTDVKSLQPVMSRLFKGEMMITVKVPDDVVGRKARSIIRDVNDKLMYVFVGDKVKEGETTRQLRDEKAAVEYLCDQIERFGDKKSKAVIARDTAGKIITTSIQANHPVEEVVNFLGFSLSDVTYDSVLNSKEVETASNLASAEERQRDIQLASARTAAEGARLLQLTEEERKNLSPAEQAALLENQRIKLAIDSPNGNVRFVQVAGDSTQRLRDLITAETIRNGDKK